MSEHTGTPAPLGFKQHDHGTCVSTALATAETDCQERGLRFTPVRRRSLEILLEEHRAMGAYDVLNRLREEGLGAQPPAAYRALEFLVGNGFAHRIERLNAYVACSHPGKEHVPAFLICRDCNQIAETVALPDWPMLVEGSTRAGFAVERILVEVEGLCVRCQTGASA